MSSQFESSTAMPWFIFNDSTFGFDADKFAQELWAKGRLIIYNNGSEMYLKAIQDLIGQVIDNSYQYESVDDPAKRFQLIINGNILEIFLVQADAFNLTRNSDSKWLFNGTYETGADFTGPSGRTVEAKVYYSEESMAAKIEAANKGNKYIFHEADFVCCYLITTTRFIDNKPYHYQWLKRINGKYELYNDVSLDNLTVKSLPEKLPLCRCIENSVTGNWEVTKFYK